MSLLTPGGKSHVSVIDFYHIPYHKIKELTGEYSTDLSVMITYVNGVYTIHHIQTKNNNPAELSPPVRLMIDAEVAALVAARKFPEVI